MSPHDQPVSARRPSLTFRSRPQTAARPISVSKNCTFDQWQEASLAEMNLDHSGSAVEEMGSFPETVPRRRSAKSFSSLRRHPMDGLVALGRRLSVTIRNKSSKNNLCAAGEEEDEREKMEEDGEYCHYHHVSGNIHHKRNALSEQWNARARAWSHSCTISRHRSVNTPQGSYAPTAPVPAPIPGYGSEPPILPDDKYAGAAARAAAAAQNERMETIRLEMARREREKASDFRLTQDSESGIGIEIRDHSDISDTELDMIRIGTVGIYLLSNESLES